MLNGQVCWHQPRISSENYANLRVLFFRYTINHQIMESLARSLVFCLVCTVSAYPQGAGIESCDNGLPLHQAEPSTEPSPYTLEVSSSAYKDQEVKGEQTRLPRQRRQRLGLTLSRLRRNRHQTNNTNKEHEL